MGYPASAKGQTACVRDTRNTARAVCDRVAAARLVRRGVAGRHQLALTKAQPLVRGLEVAVESGHQPCRDESFELSANPFQLIDHHGILSLRRPTREIAAAPPSVTPRIRRWGPESEIAGAAPTIGTYTPNPKTLNRTERARNVGFLPMPPACAVNPHDVGRSCP